jgi:putative resolvase
LPTGTVIVQPPVTGTADSVGLYARVSSAEQKPDLDRQLVRLAEFAASHAFHVVEAVQEVGSGLNGHRRAMLRVLKNPAVQTVVVEHRDRLMRFGFEYVEAALAATSRKIVVVEAEERTDDMVRDLQEGIVSICAQLYGKRAAKNRAKEAMEAIACG